MTKRKVESASIVNLHIRAQRDPTIPTHYVNVVEISPTPRGEVFINFYLCIPPFWEKGKESPTEIDALNVVRIVMSTENFDTIVKALIESQTKPAMTKGQE